MPNAAKRGQLTLMASQLYYKNFNRELIPCSKCREGLSKMDNFIVVVN